MSKGIVVFSDIDSDLMQEDITRWDIKILDMPVFVDGEKYNIDYVKDAEFTKFYEAVKKGARVTTATMNVFEYQEAFEPYLKEGKDIFYVAFSSGLSATFEQLAVAIKELKEKYPERTIYYVDTLSISYGAGMLACEAAKRLKAGEKPEEVIKYISDVKTKLKLMFTVKDLKYLRAGGRITAFKAIVGGILNIKPILSVDTKSGKLVAYSTAKGMGNAIKFYLEEFKTHYNPESVLPIIILETEKTENGTILVNKVKEILGDKSDRVIVRQVGPVVGCHSGPGCFAIAFEGK